MSYIVGKKQNHLANYTSKNIVHMCRMTKIPHIKRYSVFGNITNHIVANLKIPTAQIGEQVGASPIKDVGKECPPYVESLLTL